MDFKSAEYLRLSEQFLNTFDWKGVTRDGLREWARTGREEPIRINPHKWPALRSGKAVPRDMIVAFSDYISEVLQRGRYLASAIAVPCEAGAKPAGKIPSLKRNAWRMPWSDLLAFLARYGTMPEEAYCGSPADVAAAARMTFECVGAREDRNASGDAAVAIAECVMKRSLKRYTDWLVQLWKADENTVLFATQKEGSSLTRVGVSVVVPLTESFYLKLRNGQVEDMDATSADFAVPSKYILIGAAADNRAVGVRAARAGRSSSQVLTFVYQLASLCPQGDSFPHVLGFAGTEESRKRLEALSFEDVGSATRQTEKSIMELVPPEDRIGGGDGPGGVQYFAMRATIHIYQFMIRKMQEVTE